jgi:hypothetical protein
MSIFNKFSFRSGARIKSVAHGSQSELTSSSSSASRSDSSESKMPISPRLAVQQDNNIRHDDDLELEEDRPQLQPVNRKNPRNHKEELLARNYRALVSNAFLGSSQPQSSGSDSEHDSEENTPETKHPDMPHLENANAQAKSALSALTSIPRRISKPVKVSSKEKCIYFEQTASSDERSAYKWAWDDIRVMPNIKASGLKFDWFIDNTNDTNMIFSTFARLVNTHTLIQNAKANGKHKMLQHLQFEKKMYLAWFRSLEFRDCEDQELDSTCNCEEELSTTCSSDVTL